MKILESGILSNVTGAALGSGVSSAPIDLSLDRPSDYIGVWLSIEGDLGRTGGSVGVVAKGCYQKSGTTFTSDTTGQYLIKSGTSVSGFFGNGSKTKYFAFPFPWMRLEAFASKAGVTNHGSGTTNSCVCRYAVCVP